MQPPQEVQDQPVRGFWKRLKNRFTNHGAERVDVSYYPGNVGHHLRPSTPPQNVSFPPVYPAISPPLNQQSRPIASPAPLPRVPALSPPRASLHGTLIARMPTDRSEQRRLASSLLEELDAYERLQRRVMLFQLLPPLRFHVTVVRHVNGVPQRTEAVMNSDQLRVQLIRILNSESAFGSDQPRVLFENLSNLRIRQGVRDISVYPTHAYVVGSFPEDKNTCPICLSGYEEGEEIRTIPCLHFYHRECIDEWLSQSKECPLCKMKIEN